MTTPIFRKQGNELVEVKPHTPVREWKETLSDFRNRHNEYMIKWRNLRRYTLANPNDWEENKDYPEGSFEVRWGVNTDVGRWTKITDYVYSIYPENLQKLCSQKVYPVPAKAEESQEENDFDWLARKIASGGFKGFDNITEITRAASILANAKEKCK